MTYKFKLYPSEKDEEKLLKTLELTRWVYNHFLAKIRDNHKVPNRITLQATLPRLKDDKPELKEVYSKVLQYVLYQLYSNLKALSQLKKNGGKIGKLRFKGRGWYKTFCYNQSGFKIVKTKKRLDLLHLSNVGDIPIRIHREIKGKVKQVTVKRYPSGKWFACVCIEQHAEAKSQGVKVKVGIDVGLKHFLTDSEGRHVENPKFYKKSLKRIRIEHRKLSRKKRDSKNREKQRIRLARAYEKIVNQRDDFLHKLSRFYVNNYGMIAVENLNIGGMTKNHYLAGKILDASWAKFLQILEFKAERAGALVVKVNPRGTSKIYKHGELDRDFNASLNILERGLSGMGQPFEPAETRPPRVIPASLVVETGSSFRWGRGSSLAYPK